MNNASATYEESSVEIQTQAQAAEVQKIAGVFQRFNENINAASKSIVDAANDAREIGLHLQTMCGHEQMKLSFWNNHCEGKVGFGFETAKQFIGIAKRLPNRIKKISGIPHVIQPMLLAADQLDLPHRKSAHSASTISFVERFLTEVTMVHAPFARAIRENPIENWNEVTIKKFLSETEWLAFERQKAEKLLKSKSQ